MTGYQGVRCHECNEYFKNFHEHLKQCDLKTVKVYIFSPQYECPGHYPWSVGPLGPSACYQDHAYFIPREQYERWQQAQDAWEDVNEEMHQLTGKV